MQQEVNAEGKHCQKEKGKQEAANGDQRVEFCSEGLHAPRCLNRNGCLDKVQALLRVANDCLKDGKFALFHLLSSRGEVPVACQTARHSELAEESRSRQQAARMNRARFLGKLGMTPFFIRLLLRNCLNGRLQCVKKGVPYLNHRFSEKLGHLGFFGSLRHHLASSARQ